LAVVLLLWAAIIGSRVQTARRLLPTIASSGLREDLVRAHVWVSMITYEKRIHCSLWNELRNLQGIPEKEE
jgi:hypothetical protein